jgi:hypothetical protein
MHTREIFYDTLYQRRKTSSIFEGHHWILCQRILFEMEGAFEDTFEYLLLEAKNLATESTAHSQASFDSIVETMNLGLNPQHLPLGQMALNYQMYAKSPNTHTILRTSSFKRLKFTTFQVMEDPETRFGDKIRRLVLIYDSFLYSESDIESIPGELHDHY